MSDETALEPIVVKKKLKANHPPHGGAWKVAYADFVTAMMAFFLLLWLLNVTTDSQKQGISNLFEPESITESEQSGSARSLMGRALSSAGALVSSGSPPSVSVPVPAFGGQNEVRGQAEAALTSKDQNPDSENVEARKREEEGFARAQSDLRLAVEQSEQLANFQDSLLVDLTPKGLRIQLLDQEQVSMFQPDSAKMTPYSEALLTLITKIVLRFPNQVAITGHTAAAKPEEKRTYSDWDISGQRANFARRVMLEAGLPQDRLASVIGKGDNDHLYPKEPFSPQNRRISILLVTTNPKEAIKIDG